MKVLYLVILAKYAQGGIIFRSFFDHVSYLNADKRTKLLSQTVELIEKLQLQDIDITEAVKKTQLNSDTRQVLILNSDQTTKEKLAKLLELQGEDLEDTLKLILNLFSECYRRAFEMNKNNDAKFWYWDYLDEARQLQVVELDPNQEIGISDY